MGGAGGCGAVNSNEVAGYRYGRYENRIGEDFFTPTGRTSPYPNFNVNFGKRICGVQLVLSFSV